MHPASSHKRRYDIVRESELDFFHLPNKYIFYLETQKLGTFPLLRSMKQPLHSAQQPILLSISVKKRKKERKKENACI